MPRRALRPSFVVTFALGAATIAGGCNGNNSANGPIFSNPPILLGDGGRGKVECPAEMPATGAPCDGSASCSYPMCVGGFRHNAVCQQEGWFVFAGECDAAAPVDDGSTDGEGQDGGHD